MQRVLLTAVLCTAWLAAPGGATAATHTLRSANLRSAPVLSPATLVRTVPAGAEVEVRGQRVVGSARWLLVSAGGESGWIRADLIADEASAPADAQASAPIAAEVAAPPPAAAPVAAAAAEESAPQPETAPAFPRLGASLAPDLGVAEAEAATVARAPIPPAGGLPWPLQLLHDSQFLLAAALVSLVLVRSERRLAQHWSSWREQAVSVVHSEPVASHVDEALRNEGIRREYDRLLSALCAIERLLVPNGSNRSTFSQLTEMVASANIADSAERVETLDAIRRRMLEVGMLPAFGRVFEGLSGYAFTPQLCDKLQGFMAVPDAEIEERFDQVREGARLCFDDLRRHLVADILQGGAITFLFSRQLELLDNARAAAQSASARGWSMRDVTSLRQMVVAQLFEAPKTDA